MILNTQQFEHEMNMGIKKKRMSWTKEIEIKKFQYNETEGNIKNMAFEQRYFINPYQNFMEPHHPRQNCMDPYHSWPNAPTLPTPNQAI